MLEMAARWKIGHSHANPENVKCFLRQKNPCVLEVFLAFAGTAKLMLIRLVWGELKKPKQWDQISTYGILRHVSTGAGLLKV